MIGLVRSELLKLRTTRTMWGLLIGLVPYVAFNAFVHFAAYLFKPPPGSEPLPPLTDPTGSGQFSPARSRPKRWFSCSAS